MPRRKRGAGRNTGETPQRKPARKGRRNGGILPVIAVAIATVIIGIILLSLYGERLTGYWPFREARERREEVLTRAVTLYFSDAEGQNLAPEKRGVRKGDLMAEVRETVSSLIEGPSGELGPTIPGGTRLLGVMITGQRAYLDFSADIAQRHSGGSSGEIQTIYSIVNTVVLNFPEIKEVQILIEGKNEKTLAGHIDISLPLGADRKFIKG